MAPTAAPPSPAQDSPGIGIHTAAETRPAAIIVITDGWTPRPPTPPHSRPLTIAALTDNTRARHVPDWIQTIDITDR